MGFPDVEKCKEALLAANGDVTVAVDILSAGFREVGCDMFLYDMSMNCVL